MPRVTVAIPTYGRPEFLRQAITSVLRQTFRDFTLLVSDDGTNPETPEVAHSFGDPRVRYRRNSATLGVPRHFNECARAADTEFFAVLPDDDLYAPAYLESMVRALDAAPSVGFAQTGFLMVDEDLRPLEEVAVSPEAFVASGENALIWQMRTLRCNPGAVVFRASVIRAMGLWREDYVLDDWAFAVRVAYRDGFTFVPKVLAYVRQHDANLSATMGGPAIDQIYRLIHQQADVFGEADEASDAVRASQEAFARETSHRCVIAALRSLLAGDWQEARRGIRVARGLNPMAGLDPAVLIHALRSLQARRENALRRREASSKEPVVDLSVVLDTGS